MNIYDIAKKAGVSIATVSRIINNSGNVSEKTRQKVEQVMKEESYNPSIFARGMVTNSMKTVGVLAIDIRDIFYANVTYTIEQQLSMKGYNVILCNTGSGNDNKKHYIKMLINKKMDGLILVGSVFNDKNLEQFIIDTAKSVPIVLVNGYIKGKNIYSVACDDSLGIKKCVKHLKDLDRKDIVFLQDTDTYSAYLKAKGFKSMVPEGKIFMVQKGLEGGYNGIKEIVNSKIPFDAIITSEDITSIGALKYLNEIGTKVPDDIAITGFNNTILSNCCLPELTTVDSNMEQVGKMSVDVLTDVLSGQNAQSRIIIEPKLIIRKSTKL